MDFVLDITRVIEKEKPSTVDHVLLDAGLGGVLDSHVHDVLAPHHRCCHRDLLRGTREVLSVTEHGLLLLGQGLAREVDDGSCHPGGRKAELAVVKDQRVFEQQPVQLPTLSALQSGRLSVPHSPLSH